MAVETELRRGKDEMEKTNESVAEAAEQSYDLAVGEPDVKPADNQAVSEPAVESQPELEAVEQPEQPEPPVHREGTPDKAMQKVQQDAIAIERKLDALMEKVDRGEKLSKRETAEVHQQKRKLDDIRQYLAGKKFDAIDHAEDVAGALVETDDRVAQLGQEVESLRNELLRTRASSAWGDAERRYPGVDHRGIWAKAQEDAVDLLGGTDGVSQEALHRLSSKLFHERADAASKGVAAKNKAPALPAKPKPTPGATAISGKQAGKPPVPESDELAIYRHLAVET